MENIDLIKIALEAQKNSYAPYSNYKVGAVLETNDGKLFLGCNVESASYGATNCAERTALFSAVANGYKDFVKIAIVGGDLSDYAFPCGICRQVLNEFNPNLKVIVAKKNDTGEFDIKEVLLNDLLPYAFGAKNIKY